MTRRLDLKTGFQCNNRCTFCVQGDKRYEYGNKSTDELKQALAEARVDCDDVVFTGGEVTIRTDLPELVAHAKQLGYNVIQIQTNGRMLSNQDFVDRLVEAGANEFAPAIHGHTAELHDTQTRAPNSFRQTVKGIINVKKLGFPVVINSVITRQNYEHIPDMAKLFVALHVDQYQFAFVHALGTAAQKFDEVVPRYTDIKPFVFTGLSIGAAAGVRCMTEAIPLCILGSYRNYAAEWIIPKTRIVDATWVVEDYKVLRVTEGKAKGPRCEDCALDQECEGPWREYPEHFGWDEFEPVPAEHAA